MNRSTLSAALLAAAAALSLTTMAAAASSPVPSRPAHRAGAALAILLGGCILPAACLIGSAREMPN